MMPGTLPKAPRIKACDVEFSITGRIDCGLRRMIWASKRDNNWLTVRFVISISWWFRLVTYSLVDTCTRQGSNLQPYESEVIELTQILASLELYYKSIQMRAAASDDLSNSEAYGHDKRKALRQSVFQSNPPKTGDSACFRSPGRSIHIEPRGRRHVPQGKTVDNVIVSAPVEAFSQVNAAQFYVSMSRARQSMHPFTDSKAALKEAVARPSERVSAI
jgi:hypothetical protein